MAGDRVELRDGWLRINGVALQSMALAGTEDFGAHRARLDLGAGGGPDIHGLTIPPGKLLVLGDHRGDSFDGRYFGLVDADRVYGKALAVYYRRGEGLAWIRL